MQYFLIFPALRENWMPSQQWVSFFLYIYFLWLFVLFCVFVFNCLDAPHAKKSLENISTLSSGLQIGAIMSLFLSVSEHLNPLF